MILSAPLHASDLMAIYREALEGDAQYGAARAAFQAAQEKLPQGRAGFLPSITFTGNQRKQLIQAGNNPEHLVTSPDYHSALSSLLASRSVLQMDKTTSSDQKVLRHQ
jgi:outer membrane protein TolC